MNTVPGAWKSGAMSRRPAEGGRRGTVNSLMAAAGVPAHIRARWCGHTEAVNERTYTHARPEDLAAAGAALSRICNAV
jgi:integrase